MVVEDQGEPILAAPERQQRPVIKPGAAVHEHQRVAASDDFDKEGHVSNPHRCHGSLPFSIWRCWYGTSVRIWPAAWATSARSSPASTTGRRSRVGRAPKAAAPGRPGV